MLACVFVCLFVWLGVFGCVVRCCFRCSFVCLFVGVLVCWFVNLLFVDCRLVCGALLVCCLLFVVFGCLLFVDS